MNDNFFTMNENFFANFFDRLTSSKSYCERLDDYWRHGKVEQYYCLLNNCKSAGFRVMRNSAGEHRVEAR